MKACALHHSMYANCLYRFGEIWWPIEAKNIIPDEVRKFIATVFLLC